MKLMTNSKPSKKQRIQIFRSQKQHCHKRPIILTSIDHGWSKLDAGLKDANKHT